MPKRYEIKYGTRNKSGNFLDVLFFFFLNALALSSNRKGILPMTPFSGQMFPKSKTLKSNKQFHKYVLFFFVNYNITRRP
jgi:hypothetical protein